MPWSVGTLVSKPHALPQVTWNPPEKLGEIFGYHLAYYNPCHETLRPQILNARCVGFYSVTEPFPSEPTCAILHDHILAIILLPLTPVEASAHFDKEGWEGCEKIATHKFFPNPAKAVAA